VKTEPASVTTAEFPCVVCGARLDSLHLEPSQEGSVCTFCGARQSVQDARPQADVRTPGRGGSSLDVADSLRNARQLRGETLEEISQATRIRESYLAELEDGGASFEPYPGRVYGRFFLREYAQYLGLDPGPLVREFDGNAEPEPTLAPSAPSSRRRTTIIGAVFGLFCVVAILSLPPILWGDRPSGVPAIGAGIPSPRALRHPHAPIDAGAPQGIRAVATVRDRCWIEAIADGETIYRRTASAGSTVVFRANRTLRLTLGNAGGVALQLNGHRVTTGASADVVRLSFAWRDHRVVQT
jgi:transcriptional regulator with XRE-family HTH domain